MTPAPSAPSPRPKGFDYSKPDPESVRCMNCNPDGMCRTGMRSISPYGTTTTVYWAVPCELKCNKGLKP